MGLLTVGSRILLKVQSMCVKGLYFLTVLSGLAASGETPGFGVIENENIIMVSLSVTSPHSFLCLYFGFVCKSNVSNVNNRYVVFYLNIYTIN